MSQVRYNSDYSITVDGVTYSPEEIAKWASSVPPEEIVATCKQYGVDPYMVVMAYNVATGSTITPDQASEYLGTNVTPKYVSHVDANNNLVVNGKVYTPIDVYNWVTNTPPEEVSKYLYALGIDPKDVVDIYNTVSHTKMSYAYAANYWNMPVDKYDPDSFRGRAGSGSGSSQASSSAVTIPTDLYPTSDSQYGQVSFSGSGIDWSTPVSKAAEEAILTMIPLLKNMYNNYFGAANALLYGNNYPQTSNNFPIPLSPPSDSSSAQQASSSMVANSPMVKNNILSPAPPVLFFPHKPYNASLEHNDYLASPNYSRFNEYMNDFNVSDYEPLFQNGILVWNKNGGR